MQQNSSIFEPFFDHYVAQTFYTSITIKWFTLYFILIVYFDENWACLLRKPQSLSNGFILSLVQ